MIFVSVPKIILFIKMFNICVEKRMLSHFDMSPTKTTEREEKTNKQQGILRKKTQQKVDFLP